MKIKDVMSRQAFYIKHNANLTEAASNMIELDCGFLPIASDDGTRLQGVITDRDIVVRTVAQGMDPNKSSVKDAMSDRVLYCFENDDLESAAKSMATQGVYRLVVLNNDQQKKLSGIVSLGDIMTHGSDELAATAAKEIITKAA